MEHQRTKTVTTIVTLEVLPFVGSNTMLLLDLRVPKRVFVSILLKNLVFQLLKLVENAKRYVEAPQPRHLHLHLHLHKGILEYKFLFRLSSR